jgi:hypothetical protein
MTKGIMESFRKDIGFLEKDFKKTDDYYKLMKIAEDVVQEMQNSSVIADIRNISKQVFESYNEQFFECPTGHKYFVTESTFRNVFANFLISYEFSILAHATLKTVETYNSKNDIRDHIEVIGHYHDGNVLLINKDDKDKILQILSDNVKDIGIKLGLQYIQKIEAKEITLPEDFYKDSFNQLKSKLDNLRS